MTARPDPLRGVAKRLRAAGRARLARLVLERRCGQCSACCTVKSVPGVTAALERCPHLAQPGRCAVYAERPEPCRTFYCGWRVGIGGPLDRPDRAGFFLDAAELPEADSAGMVVRAWQPFDVARALALCREAAELFGVGVYFAAAGPWVGDAELPFKLFARFVAEGDLEAMDRRLREGASTTGAPGATGEAP